MIYHFTKVVGFDVDVNSLDEAKLAAMQVDMVLEHQLDAMSNCMIGGCLHSGEMELAGYTSDESEEGKSSVEEEFLDYLCDEDEYFDEDENDCFEDCGNCTNRSYCDRLGGEEELEEEYDCYKECCGNCHAYEDDNENLPEWFKLILGLTK